MYKRCFFSTSLRRVHLREGRPPAVARGRPLPTHITWAAQHLRSCCGRLDCVCVRERVVFWQDDTDENLIDFMIVFVYRVVRRYAESRHGSNSLRGS